MAIPNSVSTSIRAECTGLRASTTPNAPASTMTAAAANTATSTFDVAANNGAMAAITAPPPVLGTFLRTWAQKTCPEAWAARGRSFGDLGVEVLEGLARLGRTGAVAQ